MSRQCKTEVRESGMWPRFHQCKRKAWKDGYCKQHHPDSVAERRRKSDENFRARSGAFLKVRIAELKAENTELKAKLARVEGLQRYSTTAIQRHHIPVRLESGTWVRYDELQAALEGKADD